MSKKTTADYLRDMLQELAEITLFTSEGKAHFIRDSKTRKAVIRSYEVLGEIAKRLPDHLRKQPSPIDWRQLIGFRDFLAHHYEEVILENVWLAVQDLPKLRQAVQALLDSLPDEEDES